MVSDSGSVGMSSKSGSKLGSVPVNVRVSRFAYTEERISLPEAGRSGVLKYSYTGMVTCSITEPSGLVSRSKIVMDARAVLGSTRISFMLLHE